MSRCLNWLVAVEMDPEEPFPEKAKRLPQGLSKEELDFVERELRVAQTEEADRDRGIQARLIALLGLSSLLTALLSGAAALTTTLHTGWSSLHLVCVLAVAGYVALQALRAIQCTINGLLPKPYETLALWRRSGKRSMWRQRQRLSKQITIHRRSVWTNNRRADDMILALRSLRRLAWGVGVLIVVFGIFALDQRFEFLPEVIGAVERASQR